LRAVARATALNPDA